MNIIANLFSLVISLVVQALKGKSTTVPPVRKFMVKFVATDPVTVIRFDLKSIDCLIITFLCSFSNCSY